MNKNLTKVLYIAVEIKMNPPKSLYTCFDDTCSNESRLYVDYMHLKWGENGQVGSEHTISGAHFAGEVRNTFLH